MDFIAANILALGTIVILDIVLSGDNAIIIGAKAASLPAHQQKKAIWFGMGVALVARIFFSLIATWLTTIPGLRFAGGLALIWVAFGMWNDLRDDGDEDGSTVAAAASFGAALWAIAVADVSMSIDNVLAVAGAANGHYGSLIFGLVLSILIMAFAATLVAKLISRYSWIAWIGLALVLYIAGKLMYEDYANVPVAFHKIGQFIGIA